MNTAIQNGVNYLNENEPGWLDKIDLEVLDMHDPRQCLIGQISGKNYRHYLEERLSDDEAIELGFYLRSHTPHIVRGMTQEEIDALWQVADQETTEEHAALTSEWKEAVSALRRTS